jgi:hypothetical protein
MNETHVRNKEEKNQMVLSEFEKRLNEATEELIAVKSFVNTLMPNDLNIQVFIQISKEIALIESTLKRCAHEYNEEEERKHFQ